MIAEIKFACAHCGQKIAVETDAAGLSVECPTCRNPVTIPRGMTPLEPRRADGGLREKLAAVQAECERLRANATSSQAEIKSFHTERLTLRNEAAALKQRVAAAEAQSSEMALLRERLAATETQLSSMEAERAESRAALSRAVDENARTARELEGLRSELAAAIAVSTKVRDEAAEARAALATTQSGLTELQTRFANASAEVETLRGLLDRDEASRELLSTRTKLAAAEDELRMRRQSATQLEIDLLNAEAERDRLNEERGALLRQMADTMQRAETLSQDRLNADNAKLRELLDRQNEELKLRFKELTRFRRAKLTLKIVWALTALGMVGLGFVFAKILPTIEWSR